MTTDEPDNLVLRLLREMREDMTRRFDGIDSRFEKLEARMDQMASDLGDLKTDVKEVSLATSLLEVRMGKVMDRLDKIEKNVGMVKA